jgi:transposase
MNMTSTNHKETEVITSARRKRRLAPIEKKSIVMETYQNGVSVSYIARKYGISPSQLFLWRRKMEEAAMTGVDSEDSVVPVGTVKELEKRIRRLERLLGQKTEEVEILKEAVKIGREKKLISRRSLEGLENFE